MKKIIAIIGLSVIGISIYSCTDSQTKGISVNVEVSNDSLIQRGEYLVNTIGCADCHSPKEMTQNGPRIIDSLHLSGYPSSRKLTKVKLDAMQSGYVLMNGDLTATLGPWGVTYAANISSDETGIGNWTLEQFELAMVEGKYKGLANARNLLPPMPTQNFRNLNKSDLKAIYLYLKSTKPVRNVVPNVMSLEEYARL